MFFGPDGPNFDYYEIGRCVGALMNNEVSEQNAHVCIVIIILLLIEKGILWMCIQHEQPARLGGEHHVI